MIRTDYVSCHLSLELAKYPIACTIRENVNQTYFLVQNEFNESLLQRISLTIRLQ